MEGGQICIGESTVQRRRSDLNRVDHGPLKGGPICLVEATSRSDLEERGHVQARSRRERPCPGKGGQIQEERPRSKHICTRGRCRLIPAMNRKLKIGRPNCSKKLIYCCKERAAAYKRRSTPF
jgi:hypothetical protein